MEKTRGGRIAHRRNARVTLGRVPQRHVVLLVDGSGAPPGVPVRFTHRGPCSGSVKGVVEQAKITPSGDATVDDKFDDEDYPAYSMGSAAQILGTTPAFLRSLDEARLLTPRRSQGGHRRYSRYQLRIAARVRELVDHGTPLEAACRIIILEDQLADAEAINAALHRGLQAPPSTSGSEPVR